MATKPDPAQVYICIEAHTLAGPAGDEVIREGDRVRGSHFAVARNPAFFIADGATTSEIAVAKAALLESILRR